MHQVWLTARTDFTFKGTTYTAGQVFLVDPLVGVQMYAARYARPSKAPTEVSAPDVPTAVAPSRKRRTYTTKQMTATPTQAAPEPTPEPAPEPSAEPQADDPNTYDRKDLRADGE